MQQILIPKKSNKLYKLKIWKYQKFQNLIKKINIAARKAGSTQKLQIEAIFGQILQKNKKRRICLKT